MLKPINQPTNQPANQPTNQPSTYPSIYPLIQPIYPSTHLSTCPPTDPLTFSSIHPPIYPSTHLFTQPLIVPFNHLPTHPLRKHLQNPHYVPKFLPWWRLHVSGGRRQSENNETNKLISDNDKCYKGNKESDEIGNNQGSGPSLERML